MASTTETKQHLFDVLKGFDTAMLVTHSSGNGLHARPMAVAELRPGADMYFSTSLQSPKIAEISSNPAVAVTFQSRSQFASVYGNAYVVRDRALIERLWSEAWRVWFPGGKDDPSLCLIRVEAREAEYWDNAGTQGIKYVLEAVKAYAKGETPAVDNNQNAKVGL
jgi:general stress protein 26